MIKKTILSIILLLVCVFAMAQSQTITHVVQRGETIESIAKYYNVSVEDISKANPNMDGVVYVGMKLSIPQSNEPANAPNSAQPLTVTTVKSKSRPTSIDSKMYSKKNEYVPNDSFWKCWKIKAIAGVTVGTWTGKDFKDGNTEQGSLKNKALYQFHFGVVADYALLKNLYLGTGLFFNQNGYKQELLMTSGQYWDDEGANYDGRQTIKMTTNEIEVPIHIGGAYDASSDVRLFAEVGPYLSYAISGSKKTTGFFTDYDDIHSSETDYINEKEKIGKGSLKDYQKFGYGLSATAGISVNKIVFQFTFQRELSKAIKKTKKYEQNMLLSVGYEF